MVQSSVRESPAALVTYDSEVGADVLLVVRVVGPNVKQLQNRLNNLSNITFDF